MAELTGTPEGLAKSAASRVRIVFWITAIAIGAIHAWATRNAMNADGISYLDMGDAYLRGDWGMAINAYWSPLYSWFLGLAVAILKPAPNWEFAVAHLVNFLSYAAALASFDFLLMQFVRHNRERTDGPSTPGATMLPEWTIMAIGYALFIYFTPAFITLRLVTPDLLVSAFIYLACALLYRIRSGQERYAAYTQFGMVLALGYLAKTAMFGFAVVLLALVLFSAPRGRGFKRGTRYAAAALVGFTLLSAPLIGAISLQQGRLTFGESGKMNYAWYVNGVRRYVHWQGDPPGNGTPRHPTRVIHSNPPVYEFGSPVEGTYPPWYNPVYWYDGLEIHLNGGQIARVASSNILIYLKLMVRTQLILLAGTIVLLAFGRVRSLPREVARHWVLLVPALAGLAMYSLVTEFQDPRYIGPYLVILWLALLGGVRLRGNRRRLRTAAAVAAAVVVTQLLLAPPASNTLYPPASVVGTTATMLGDAIGGVDRVTDISSHVAAALRREGIRPGDRIAMIGDPFEQYWARLARVRFIAEVPSVGSGPSPDGEPGFWQCSESTRADVMETLAKTGAKIVVANITSEKKAQYVTSIGWLPIGSSNLYAYRLQD